MARAPNRLIYHYSGVNIDVVWQIVDTELPKILSMLECVVIDERGD